MRSSTKATSTGKKGQITSKNKLRTNKKVSKRSAKTKTKNINTRLTDPKMFKINKKMFLNKTTNRGQKRLRRS
jgi:hypothetical protein